MLYQSRSGRWRHAAVSCHRLVGAIDPEFRRCRKSVMFACHCALAVALRHSVALVPGNARCGPPQFVDVARRQATTRRPPARQCAAMTPRGPARFAHRGLSYGPMMRMRLRVLVGCVRQVLSRFPPYSTRITGEMPTIQFSARNLQSERCVGSNNGGFAQRPGMRSSLIAPD